VHILNSSIKTALNKQRTTFLKFLTGSNAPPVLWNTCVPHDFWEWTVTA